MNGWGEVDFVYEDLREAVELAKLLGEAVELAMKNRKEKQRSES